MYLSCADAFCKLSDFALLSNFWSELCDLVEVKDNWETGCEWSE